MKVAILGYSGSGKSTLARKIGEKCNIPVLHLDKVNFTKNWKERETSEAREIVEEFLQNDSWVIDGNYSKLEQDRRIKEADKIIFLDFPARVCLHRAYKRYLENKNKTRIDMANDCKEKLDFEFIKWILFGGRDKKHKEKYQEICNKYKDKTIICKNSREVDEVLERL